MGINYSPKIVTDGLVLCLDAANPLSYPGTGNIWYDLSGNNLNAIKYGSPSFGLLNSSHCWRFTANGQYFNTNTSMVDYLNGSNLTLESFIYPETDVATGDRGTIIVNTSFTGYYGFYQSLNKSNRKQSNYWYGKTLPGYHELGSAMINNSWYHLVSIWDGSVGKLYQFLNMTKTVVNTVGTNANTAPYITIGQEQSATGRQFAGGISLIRIYNRALTDDQVQQNYLATKGRFGL
jgi:hypothetical protein